MTFEDTGVAVNRYRGLKLKFAHVTNESDSSDDFITDEGLEGSGTDGGLNDVGHLETGLWLVIGEEKS